MYRATLSFSQPANMQVFDFRRDVEGSRVFQGNGKLARERGHPYYVPMCNEKI